MNSPNGYGTIKAEYTDPCYPSATTLYTDHVYYDPNTSPATLQLIAPGALIPTSSIAENKIMRVQELSACAPYIGQAQAYGNISDFHLLILDRWGVNFRTISKGWSGRAQTDAVLQGDIIWDGRDNSGALVQDAVYAFKLYVNYCGNSGYTDITDRVSNATVGPCMEWNFWGTCKTYLSGSLGPVKCVTVLN